MKKIKEHKWQKKCNRKKLKENKISKKISKKKRSIKENYNEQEIRIIKKI